jgi:hypothetical protein
VKKEYRGGITKGGRLGKSGIVGIILVGDVVGVEEPEGPPVGGVRHRGGHRGREKLIKRAGRHGVGVHRTAKPVLTRPVVSGQRRLVGRRGRVARCVGERVPM